MYFELLLMLIVTWCVHWKTMGWLLCSRTISLASSVIFKLSWLLSYLLLNPVDCCVFLMQLICGLLLCDGTDSWVQVSHVRQVSTFHMKKCISWRLLLTFSSFQQRFLQLLPNQNGCGRCGLIELLHGWQHQRSRDDGELNSSPVSKNGISQSILLTFSPFMMHSPSL
jgi:hypothetical protein